MQNRPSHTVISAAMDHVRAGQFEAAERLCRQILATQQSADALNILGSCLASTARFAEAAEVYQQLIRQSGEDLNALNNLSACLYRCGRFDEAVRISSRSANAYPQSAIAHYNLGLALSRGGMIENAIESLRAATTIDPTLFDAWMQLAALQKARGRFGEAIDVLRQALLNNPKSVPALFEMGVLLLRIDKPVDALGCLQKAIALKPDYAEVIGNIGLCYQAMKQYDRALDAFAQVAKINPTIPDTYNNMGMVLQRVGDLPAAAAAFEQAIALKRDYPVALSNLGSVLTIIGGPGKALASHQQAVELQNADDTFHWNYSVSLLLLGDYAKGWREFEHRPTHRDVQRKIGRSIPRWDGSDPRGKRIYLPVEQGLGDFIQFVRFVPSLKERGATILLECPPPLRRLMSGSSHIDGLFSPDGGAAEADLFVPLMSLAGALNATPGNLCAEEPYIRVDPELSERWGRRLGERSKALRIGLVWAGSAGHLNNRNRSMLFLQFAPLAEIRAEWFSLQKGPPAAEAVAPTAPFFIRTFENELSDFAETAGCIANLDLIISVDTSVAHLAGAMGKPVWLLIPFEPDWRWMLRRRDTPWYPTARLFRQTRFGDWDDVVRRVCEELNCLVA